MIGHRFDVDVGCRAIDSLLNNLGNKADNRRFAGKIAEAINIVFS